MVSEEIFMKTMCGTPLYVAPEILASDGKRCYNSQVDVWSLGVILFIWLLFRLINLSWYTYDSSDYKWFDFSLSGYLPFSQDYKGLSLQEQIMRGRAHISESHWKNVSWNARNLVNKMLTVNPSARITINEILNDIWMQDEDVIKTVDQLQRQILNIENFDKLTVKEVKEISQIPKRILSDIANPPSKRRKVESGHDSSTSSAETI